MKKSTVIPFLSLWTTQKRTTTNQKRLFETIFLEQYAQILNEQTINIEYWIFRLVGTCTCIFCSFLYFIYHCFKRDIVYISWSIVNDVMINSINCIYSHFLHFKKMNFSLFKKKTQFCVIPRSWLKYNKIYM